MNNIEIIRSKRKTLAIEITRDLRVIVRVPLHLSDKGVERFITEKSDWIDKHIPIMKSRVDAEKQNCGDKFTAEEIRSLADKARGIIPERVKYYAEIIGVDYGAVTIRSQVSRWGSCSAKRNLSFNCLLMLCPPEVLDYVVIHELCHLREMNHSKKFWDLVGRFCPEYKARKKWLNENGSKFADKLRRGLA